MPRQYTQAEARAICWEGGWIPPDGWVYVNNKTRIPGRCRAGNHPSLPGEGPTLGNILKPGVGVCKPCIGYDQPTTAQAREASIKQGWIPNDDWEYRGSEFQVPGRCVAQGHVGPGPRYAKIRDKKGVCHDCSGTKRLSQEEAEKRLAAVNWIPPLGWKYDRLDKAVPGKCGQCGYEGLGPSVHSATDGHGCRECVGLVPLIERVRTVTREMIEALGDGIHRMDQAQLYGIFLQSGAIGVRESSSLTARRVRRYAAEIVQGSLSTEDLTEFGNGGMPESVNAVMSSEGTEDFDAPEDPGAPDARDSGNPGEDSNENAAEEPSVAEILDAANITHRMITRGQASVSVSQGRATASADAEALEFLTQAVPKAAIMNKLFRDESRLDEVIADLERRSVA